MGFGRIEGEPQRYRGVNINGGKNPEQPASFPNKGKTGINAHDKFNLVKVTMTLAKDPAP